jgi:hypothetical protein
MIRHGEKPPQDADGLSAQGLDRANYLPQVFGPASKYNIGFILAEHPKHGKYPLSAPRKPDSTTAFWRRPDR